MLRATRASARTHRGYRRNRGDILRLAADMISIGVTIGLFAFTLTPARMAAASCRSILTAACSWVCGCSGRARESRFWSFLMGDCRG